eukprot:354922-Chlamydomonas_euryale.AAC.11
MHTPLSPPVIRVCRRRVVPRRGKDGREAGNDDATRTLLAAESACLRGRARAHLAGCGGPACLPHTRPVPHQWRTSAATAPYVRPRGGCG